MTGNYLPTKVIQSNGYRMVYVPGVSNDTPRAQEQLVRRLLTLMPASFDTVLKKKKYHWDDEEVLVLGESQSYALFVSDDGDKTAVVVAVRPGLPSYARNKLNTVADRIFEALNDDYELTVRISAEITHAYTPHLDRAA